MDRNDGNWLRAGLFFGLGFLPLTGIVLALTGDVGPGLFVGVVGAALMVITFIESLIFRRRHPVRKVP